MEIVRRLEHPPQQETDDWNAAGMEPHSPTAARLQKRKVSAAKWAGHLTTRAAGHKPNTHELRAGFHYSIWSALGKEGRGYGGASYPAPISLAAVVVPTAGRAAKPPVPLIRSTLFPA